MQGYSTHTARAADAAGAAAADWKQGADALERSKDEVVTELHDLIRECKTFLKSTAGLSTEAVAEARERFAIKLADAKDRWDELSQAARIKGRRVAVAANDYVRAEPWLAIGLAAGMAFVIATLATRRR
jgi:ElaB/YqjD/DUF883 family membrane-anchored ribosome-binding protein